jgi:hypothetical protein
VRSKIENKDRWYKLYERYLAAKKAGDTEEAALLYKQMSTEQEHGSDPTYHPYTYRRATNT